MYGLVGLALSLNFYKDKIKPGVLFNWKDFELEDMDPVFTIPRIKERVFKEFFK